MGNISSSYQTVDVSANRKWLILADCGAYINVASVAFFVVEQAAGGHRILFKLVDNDNDEHSDGWSSWAGKPISKFQTVMMTQQRVAAIVGALTEH